MSYWQAMRLLSAYILRRDWIGVVSSTLFAVYIGVVLSLNGNSLFGEQEIPTGYALLTNWMMLLFLPFFGMILNRTIFSTWRDDAYSRRLAALRVYPIPLSAIVGARVLQSVVLVPIHTALSMIMVYALSPDLQQTVSGVRWFVFAAIWMCYSLIVNALFVWLELGVSGRSYVLIYLAWIVFVTSVAATLEWQGVHLHKEVLEWTDSGALPAILGGTVGCAALALWIGYRGTMATIRSRSIAF